MARKRKTIEQECAELNAAVARVAAAKRGELPTKAPAHFKLEICKDGACRILAITYYSRAAANVARKSAMTAGYSARVIVA